MQNLVRRSVGRSQGYRDAYRSSGSRDCLPELKVVTLNISKYIRRRWSEPAYELGFSFIKVGRNEPP